MDENILDFGSDVSENMFSDSPIICVGSLDGSHTVGGGDAGVVDLGVDSFHEQPISSSLDSTDTPIILLQQVDNASSLIDDDLGGVPVYIMGTNAVDGVPIGTFNGYQMGSYYVDYFSGVLANIGDTDYLAFCTRDYYQDGYYQRYIEHYRLVYDLNIEGGEAVRGSYPCLHIYKDSGESVYQLVNETYSLTSIPSFSYGSFGTYSDLRKGGTHDVNYTILFFLAFFAVYFVCHDFFNYILQRVYRR